MSGFTKTGKGQSLGVVEVPDNTKTAEQLAEEKAKQLASASK